MKQIKQILLFAIVVVLPSTLLAQTAVVGNITDAVSKLGRIVLAIITGCGVWAGLKFAKGDQDAIQRIMMCVAGAITVGIAVALINFFKV